MSLTLTLTLTHSRKPYLKVLNGFKEIKNYMADFDYEVYPQLGPCIYYLRKGSESIFAFYSWFYAMVVNKPKCLLVADGRDLTDDIKKVAASTLKVKCRYSKEQRQLYVFHTFK